MVRSPPRSKSRRALLRYKGNEDPVLIVLGRGDALPGRQYLGTCLGNKLRTRGAVQCCAVPSVVQNSAAVGTGKRDALETGRCEGQRETGRNLSGAALSSLRRISLSARQTAT